MKFLEYSCFKPPSSTFPQWKSQCSWSPIFGESPQPTQRSSHAICVYHNQIFMYGGRGDKGTLKEFWMYDCDTSQWKEQLWNGCPPPRLEGHSMVVYDGKIYVFGGETSFASADESPLWQYDINEKVWNKLGSSSAVMAPCGRRQHTAVLYMDAMCIYGGYQDLIGPTKEMWLYDFGSKSWHFDVAASHDGAPDARYGHCAVVNNQSMWVCGGLTGLKPNSEVLSWNFEHLVWMSLKAKGGPSELSGHAMCAVNNSLYVFGGCNASGVSLSEMWRLSLSDSTWRKCHSNNAVKPPAISGHCVILYQAPCLFERTELRTRSFPDIKKKRSRSKTPPTKQRSVSCGKLPNETSFPETVPVGPEEERETSDKAALIAKQDTKVLYAYENSLTEIIDEDIEILPKIEPEKSAGKNSVDYSAGLKLRPLSASKGSFSVTEYRTGYVSSRSKKYGSLSSGGNALSTFSYNLIEDSRHHRAESANIEETSFINLRSDSALLHQQTSLPNSTNCENVTDFTKDTTFPAITKVKPLHADSSGCDNLEVWGLELESPNHAHDQDDTAETYPDASSGNESVEKASGSTANNTIIEPFQDIAQRFEAVAVRSERNNDFMLLVFGGNVSSSHPNSNKPFSLWQCSITPAS